jgi:hypothetical protein
MPSCIEESEEVYPGGEWTPVLTMIPAGFPGGSFFKDFLGIQTTVEYQGFVKRAERGSFNRSFKENRKSTQ